jgi:hypothetical protein
MGVPLEEKALGENIHSLEEKVSVFFGEDMPGEGGSDDGSSLEAKPDEYESDTNASPDPLERTLYWESQQALLQVYLYIYIYIYTNLRIFLLISETIYVYMCELVQPCQKEKGKIYVLICAIYIYIY